MGSDFSLQRLTMLSASDAGSEADASLSVYPRH